MSHPTVPPLPRHPRFRLTWPTAALFLTVMVVLRAVPVPPEPVEIGVVPQFFIDDYLIDNRWALNYDHGSTQMVTRVAHQPKKYAGNPVLVPAARTLPPDQQPNAGWCNVIRDPATGQFRIWYQQTIPKVTDEGPHYGVAYAESADGIKWTQPILGLIDWNGSKENNVVWRGIKGRRGSSAYMVDAPEGDRRGYRYLMLYLDQGIQLVGSKDGVHWDRSSVTVLAKMHSDTLNCIVYDAARKEYVMFCRAKHIYRVGGDKDVLEVGESRRVARMASKELWAEWKSEPQNILVADEIDAQSSYTAFYGMPAQIYGGIYWGFAEAFKWNTAIEPELAFSRDGLDFQRLPLRSKFIPLGAEGTWDDGMVLSPTRWIEVGDEWWFYYSGWDGPHNVKDVPRLGNIGLAKARKEGLISMRGPVDGGVICTRRIRWPGGKLMVNVDARKGEFSVRVVDDMRKVIPGFGYDDFGSFKGNDVRHEVKWKGGKMESLKGRVIRVEFFLKDADLYTFRATG